MLGGRQSLPGLDGQDQDHETIGVEEQTCRIHSQGRKSRLHLARRPVLDVAPAAPGQLLVAPIATEAPFAAKATEPDDGRGSNQIALKEDSLSQSGRRC